MVNLEPLYPFFKEDDGSLPDIFLENLSQIEFERVFMACLAYTKPIEKIPVWHIRQDQLIHLKPTDYFKAYLNAEINTQTIHLDKIEINSVKLPQINMFIYGSAKDNLETINLDYRMGENWDDKRIIGLLEFLSNLLDIAPHLNIKRCPEGFYEKPSAEFSKTLSEYYSHTRNMTHAPL